MSSKKAWPALIWDEVLSIATGLILFVVTSDPRPHRSATN